MYQTQQILSMQFFSFVVHFSFPKKYIFCLLVFSFFSINLFFFSLPPILEQTIENKNIEDQDIPSDRERERKTK